MAEKEKSAEVKKETKEAIDNPDNKPDHFFERNIKAARNILKGN